MSRSLFVDVAVRTTGSSDLRAVGTDLDRADQSGRRATLALTAVGVSAGIAGVAALRMGDEYDEALDSIRLGTGATGTALQGLEQSFRNVAGRVKEDIGLVAAVMADLNTRTGLTGVELELLTENVIKFSRVTGTDAVKNTADITRVFGDWGIATEDQAETLDQLFRASQSTGLGVDALMQTVVQFGAPMRTLGFTFEESIALLGKWEKEGVNAEAVLAGMKIGLGNLASEGVPANEMAATFRARLEAIRTSGTPAADAIKLFGKRAGPDLSAAILEGRFSIDDLLATIEGGSETVAQAAEDTRDFGDGIAELKNQIKLAVGPITADFAGLASELGNAIFLLPVLGGGIGKVTAALWLKHKALLANVGASSSYKASLLGAGAALGAFAAAVMIANEAGNGMEAEYNGATAAVQGMTAATREEIAEMERAGHAAIERSSALKLMGFWDTEASTSLRTLGHELLSNAERLKNAGAAAEGTADSAGLLDTALEGLRLSAQAVEPAAERGERALEGLGRGGHAADRALRTAQRAIDESSHQIARSLPDALDEGREDAERIAAQTPGDIASALRRGRDSWKSSLDLLKDDLESSMKRGKEIAKLEAVLTGKAIANGLASTDPIVRAQANQTVNEIEERLSQLRGVGTDAGETVGSQLARALNGQTAAVGAAAANLANRIRNQLKLSSPAKEGPWSEAGGPIEWMRQAGRKMRGALDEGLTGDVRVPGLMAPAGTRAAWAGAGAPITVNVYAGVGDPVEIGRKVHETLRAYHRASGTES